MKTFTLQSGKKGDRNNRGARCIFPAACLFVLIIAITGCANFPVVVNDDPFKGVKSVSVDMWHTVLDSDLDNIRTLYHKKISKGEVSDPIAVIVFVAVVDPYYGYRGED